MFARSGKASRADGQQAGAEAGASAAATGLDDDLACLFGSMKVEDAPKRRGSEQPAGNSEQQAPAGGSQQQAGSDGATAPSRATRNALLNRVLQVADLTPCMQISSLFIAPVLA